MKAFSMSPAVESMGPDSAAGGAPGAHAARGARGHRAATAHGRNASAAFPDLLGEALAGKGSARAEVGDEGKVGVGDQGEVEGQVGVGGGGGAPAGPSPRKRCAGASDAAEPGASPAGVHVAAAAGHAAAPAPARISAAAPKTAPVRDDAVGRAASGAGKPLLGVPGPARPVTEKDREKDKAREARPAEPTAPARSDPILAPAAAPAERTSPTRSPALAAPPAPLPPPPAGQELQGAVLRSAAHLKVDAGALGAVELHLRVREGALHLRVEGDAARLVEARVGELSRALAREGLTLAPIEPSTRDAGTPPGGEGGRGFEERRDAWREAAEARERGEPDPEARRRPGAARNHHVKA